MSSKASQSHAAAGKSSPAPYEELLLQLERQRMEREIAFRQAIEERRAALKLAESREAFKWSASTGLLTGAMTALSAVKQKNLIHALPLLPIFGYLGYELNVCYGGRRERILRESDKIMLESGPNLAPQPITPVEVHERIMQNRDFI
ncbi:hypothetical protein L596_002152 [Steinernema carpocapsae]|uniref:Plasminogen receptor (KT) n=1 Tax=Steinernema carpocapsae TaxID=34508 RepID=A0A4U8UQD9_STECR|nr:hypothetical protein L596_002152 [Steinernema carpocapsae]